MGNAAKGVLGDRQATDSDARRTTATESARQSTGRRSIGRHRPLPSGRAVVGGLLIALAAVGGFVLSGQDAVDVRVGYMVAASDLPPGHVLEATDVRTELLDLPAELAAAATTAESQLDLIGAVVLGPVGSGELLQRQALTPPGVPGQASTAVEFSFSIDESSVPRSLRPGEHIAMLSTTGRDNAAVTEVIVADAVVTDVEMDDDGFGATGDVTVTIAIGDSEDVLSAVNAAQATEITILRIPADGTLVLPASTALPEPEPDAVQLPLPLPVEGDTDDD